MSFPPSCMRTRLLLSSILPAILTMLVLELVFLNYYQDALERNFEERGIASVRQIGAAAEYALFSGSREALTMLAEGAHRGDPAIKAVSVLDRNGKPIVRAGESMNPLPEPQNLLQVRKIGVVTVVMTPIHQVSIMLDDDSETWRDGARETNQRLKGYIVLEISRAELAERQREMLVFMLVVICGGVLLAGWLSMRMAGGVIASLDAAHAALRREKEHAELLASTDALTGLANRRAFDGAAEQEVKRALRYHMPLALVMTDLDRFKTINDRFGHHVGDQVLQHFSHTLSAAVRNIDLVGRWGGEEFAILMPGTDLEEAARAAERMRQVVQNSVPPPGDGACAYTASFGVATLHGETPTLVSLFRRADAALYRAKDKGRNRVELG